MKNARMFAKSLILLAALVLPFLGQEKDPAEELKSAALFEEIKALPDGILRVKTNADGSFQSLLAKATIKTGDVPGDKKSIQALRGVAEPLCKKYFTKWREEYCDIMKAPDKTVTLQTKNDGGKDALGNSVKLVCPKGQEFKVLTMQPAMSAKGLSGGGKEITKDGKEFIFTMYMTTKTLTEIVAFVEAKDSGKGKAAPGKEGK